MGSCVRMDRCERFRKELEQKIINRAPIKQGDWLEVQNVAVGMAEDGTEVSKVYYLVKNKRTGDEEELTVDNCLYDPEGQDDDNVERLYSYLYGNDSSDADDVTHKEHLKKVISLLKSAKLINKDYQEKP